MSMMNPTRSPKIFFRGFTFGNTGFYELCNNKIRYYMGEETSFFNNNIRILKKLWDNIKKKKDVIIDIILNITLQTIEALKRANQV